MDSVLNKKNEQMAGYVAPESGADTNDEDLMDNHQHLLFGGNTNLDSRTDSAVVAAPGRIGGSSQLERDTYQDLNFVSIATAVTASGATRTDLRPSAPATSYEGNPLPLMAKVGIANSVALQTPTSDYVVPAGRRSGASDKIATQLVEDSTPAPLISTEVRVTQLPAAVKKEVAQASVDALFARLGQPIAEGGSDTTTVTATANIRRSATTDAEVTAQTALPGSGGLTYRPTGDQRAPQTGESLPQTIRPHLTTAGPIGAALRVVEQTLPVVGAQNRATSDVTNRGTLVEAPMPRPGRAENTGSLGTIAGQAISEEGLLTGGRKNTNSDRAVIASEPLSPSTSIGYPIKAIDTVKLAQTFDPYSQGTPEIVVGRTQPRTTSPNGDSVVATSNPIRPVTAVVNTADGVISRVQGAVEQVLPGLKRDTQVAQNDIPTFVIKDGVVHTTTTRQAQGDSTQAPQTAVVQPRTTDGARQIVTDATNQNGLPTVLPRGDQQVLSGNNVVRTDSVRIVDAANNIINPAVVNPANANPTLGARVGEVIQGGNNVVGTDRNIVRLPDGRIQEVKPGDVSVKPGDPIARACDAHGRGCEPTGRQGEAIVRNGESVVRNSESVVRNGESVVRNGESVVRNGESVVRTADGAAKIAGEVSTANNSVKSDVVARSTENAVRNADGTVKSVEVGGKTVEIAAKVETGAKAEANVKLDGVRIAEASIKVAGEGIVVARSADVAAKAADIVVKGSADIASAQKGPEIGLRNEQNVAARAAEIVANNAQLATGDKNVRLADAIVKAAEGGRIVDANGVKLDGTVRASEQIIQNGQLAANAQNGNQILSSMQANQLAAVQKNEAVRNESANRVVEQNQVVAQNQLGQQNLIQANLAGKNNDQIIAQAVKAACENNIAAQRNPVAEVKVDQVVADILNHVRNSGKDQQAGAKVIASLDQANIAAQQLDPRALLDAAAVRRILDGQGIVLSPQAINQIMEGLRPTGTNAADYALPSIGSLNLSQIISLGERLQEAVAGASNDSSEPQPKPQLQQHRTKYFVKEGDTLESIAQEKLGDSRLFPLLITINRALVNYRLEGERKVAFVVANQYLWLPTDHELEIHKRNFFGKQGKDGKDGSISLGISSKQNTPIIPPFSFDRTREVSAEVPASLQDFRPSTNSGTVISGPVSGSNFAPVQKSESQAGVSKMAGNIDKVRHAGERESIKLDEIEFASTQVTHRQCYQVRDGETLLSIAASLESMGHISMWKLLAKINGFQTKEDGAGKPVENLFAGQFIVLPTAEELNEFKLLEKLTSCSQTADATANGAAAGAVLNAFSCVLEPKQIAPAPPPALIALAQGVGGLSTVHRLSNFTRLVLNDLPQLENCFSITVEARWNGQWKPMASYECRHGQTTRHLYNKNGEVKSMELDLPPHVIKEMAREDFVRNWNSYVTRYMDDTAERRA